MDVRRVFYCSLRAFQRESDWFESDSFFSNQSWDQPQSIPASQACSQFQNWLKSHDLSWQVWILFAKSGLSSQSKSNRLKWTLQFWGFLEGGLRWFAWRRWRACYFFNHPLSLEQFSDQTLFSEGYFVLGRVGALGPQQAAKSPPKNRDLRHAMYQAAWTMPWGEDLLSMVEMSLFLNPVGKCAASWSVVSSVSFFVRYPRTGQSVLRIDEVCCYTEARRVWNFQAKILHYFTLYTIFSLPVWVSGGTWKDLVHSISYGQAGNQVAKFYNQKSIDINKIVFFFLVISGFVMQTLLMVVQWLCAQTCLYTSVWHIFFILRVHTLSNI